MRYEWDDAKNALNIAKHGIDFVDAQAVLENSACITFEDERVDYGETRYISMGPFKGRLMVIAFTVRGNVVRIISMRKANEREQKSYKQHRS